MPSDLTAIAQSAEAVALAKEGERMVGATRFELVTFCTPSKRATRLRYAPTV